MDRPKGSLISYMSGLVKTNGGINCAQGIPGFNPPKELIEALINSSKTNIHQYAHGNGLIELRKLICEGFVKRNDFDPSNIMITNGATEAISLIYLYLRLKITSGFTVLSFDPVYESYSNLPKIYGDTFISFSPLIDGSFDFEELEKTIKEQSVNLIILCSPGNPLGKIWKKNDILKLHEICSKNGVFLVFDFVYSDIYFYDRPYIPYELIDEQTFFVSAFSKMLSITGWRIGYLVCSKKNTEDLSRIHDYTGLCAPSILQTAVAEYLNDNNFGAEYLNNLRNLVKKSFNIMSESINEAGFVTPAIDGGYFIWTRIPEKFDNGFDFALDLYEKKKVSTVPGIHFSSIGKKFIRVSIARNSDEISDAAERIKDFVLS
ncbi:MAG TPA: pyridoxal phosphate-dependent aminotransferase [bacterium]|nr:pyridoxal phosphate-dependent aminotransferase [bacterium]HPS28842.1 pyridoxal phosphate-dependent aminotransferase [bacterium]